MEAERRTAVANLEDEKRIRELEMMIQEETERTAKIKEGMEKLVASMCLNEAETEVTDAVVEGAGENFPEYELGDVFMVPKPEFDSNAPQPEATLIKDPPYLAGAEENH